MKMPFHADPTDWNAWLAAEAGRFLVFARQQTRCRQDAEDVLQEALVETWRRAGGRPEKALVFATIRRRAIDLARRNDRRQQREQTGEPESLFIHPPDHRDTTALLEQAVSRLPAPQREVISLKIWGDLTFAEIATTLEIPQGTAASRYRLALEALREHLTSALA